MELSNHLAANINAQKTCEGVNDETLAEAQLRDLDLVKEDVVIGISSGRIPPYHRSRPCLCEYGTGMFYGIISNSPNALSLKSLRVGIEAITGYLRSGYRLTRMA